MLRRWAGGLKYGAAATVVGGVNGGIALLLAWVFDGVRCARPWGNGGGFGTRLGGLGARFGGGGGGGGGLLLCICDMVCGGGGGGGWVTLLLGLGTLCACRAGVGFGVVTVNWSSISCKKVSNVRSLKILNAADLKFFLMVEIHASSSGLVPRSTSPLMRVSTKLVKVSMMARCIRYVDDWLPNILTIPRGPKVPASNRSLTSYTSSCNSTG